MTHRIDLLTNVEPQVGGNLLVAAAPRVQLVTGFARQLHQAQLDVVVHVLDGRIVRPGNFFTRNLLEGEDYPAKLLAGQHARLGNGDGVRLAGDYLEGQQHAVERKGALPLLEVGILRLAETAGPHFHLSVSAWTKARERAGKPRMRMNPSASFWL